MQQDRRFSEPEMTRFTVPAGYRHKSQINNFVNRIRGRKGVTILSEKFTSENLAKVTARLQAGKTYEIGFIVVMRTHVSSDSCVTYLQNRQALLVGAQGLTLVYSLMPEAFPVDKWVYSLDRKINLLLDQQTIYQTPFLYCYKDGRLDVGLSDFRDGLEEGDRILYFREVSV